MSLQCRHESELWFFFYLHQHVIKHQLFASVFEMFYQVQYFGLAGKKIFFFFLTQIKKNRCIFAF